MAHVPHLHLPGPWPDPAVHLDESHLHHLTRVLRVRPGDGVSYTDGDGTIGSGVFDGDAVVRGDERVAPPPPTRLTVAVAPPEARDRARFLVEKLAELGVTRIRWLRTVHGQGRPPRQDKAQAWADGALEQSRGVWRTGVDDGWCRWEDLEAPVLAARQDGGPAPTGIPAATVAIGPEGGWAEGEIPETAVGLALGPRILRVETAAVAATVLLLR